MDRGPRTFALGNILSREVGFRAYWARLGYDLWVVIAARVEPRGSQRGKDELYKPPEWIIWQAASPQLKPGAVVSMSKVEQRSRQRRSDADSD